MNLQNQQVSDSASQSFDEQFPDAEPGFKTEEGMAKAFSAYDCGVCGRRTPWFHFEKAIYLCSQDCLTRYEAAQQ